MITRIYLNYQDHKHWISNKFYIVYSGHSHSAVLVKNSRNIDS